MDGRWTYVRTGLAGVGLLLVVSACSPDSAPTTSQDMPPTTAAPIITTTSTNPSESSSTTASTTTTTVPLDQVSLSLVLVDDEFDAPVLVVADPDGGADLVVEQPGRIVRADGGDHAVVLDISDLVRYQNEKGLLGFAVHPDFQDNRLVYVSYTGEGEYSYIDELEMVDGMIQRDTRKTVIRVRQPAPNHNGGMIAFGPDRYLWIGLGDGGGANDRFGTGQDADSLLGSMLRIVVGVEGVDTYGIPSDNPFADGSDGAPEVWAIGLRNPWRWSFDGEDLWIADVGQAAVEEVNLASTLSPGLNYGWPVMEGSTCFGSSSCDRDGLEIPVAEFTHADGCSITGGVVYRGDQIPSLRGQFFYTDFCGGFLRTVDRDGRSFDWTEQTGTVPQPSGFGIGGDGEVYIVSLSGELWRIAQG